MDVVAQSLLVRAVTDVLGIDGRGWTQGPFAAHTDWRDYRGRYCLLGALRTMQTEPGYEAAREGLARALGFVRGPWPPPKELWYDDIDLIAWNDRRGRKWPDVLNLVKLALALP